MIYQPYPFVRCTKCGNEYLPSTKYFRTDTRRKSGLRSTCRLCDKQYRKTHREQRCESAHRSYVSNRERCKLQDRLYHAEHREQRNAYTREWFKSHSEQKKAYKRNRRALQKGIDTFHNANDVLEQLKRQRGKCYYCGKKLNGVYHVDHVIPLSRGGSNGPDNLVVACPWCNQSKQDKLPHEWPEGGRLL